jgi:hypothetical protein
MSAYNAQVVVNCHPGMDEGSLPWPCLAWQECCDFEEKYLGSKSR